ncbi:acyltransferase domain-containing protein [Paenibacillus sp. GCM10028914]|uniref:acyltransferase domain-containing protein n=1 Tax=Paenibacillus sp. GCM10028914 TaxID=3273416 RepID=UPI00360BB33E
MELKQFCEGIKLSPPAQEIVYTYLMNENEYQSYKQDFYNNRFSFFERVKQTSEYRILFLYLFVRFAVDAYDEYRIRGIEDEVYFDTFADIQLWCLRCKHDFDEYGIQEYNWLQEHVQLRLFKLGRLQFQPFVFDRDIELQGRMIYKNQVVLNVHIPEGEPLTPHKTQESFVRAKTFFRGITPVFICHSWLLYPQLDEVLPSDSNIIQFQNEFHIYEVDPDSKEAEQRIFNGSSSDPSSYAEHTTLQRSAKAYLIAGNKLGSGFGIKI